MLVQESFDLEISRVGYRDELAYWKATDLSEAVVGGLQVKQGLKRFAMLERLQVWAPDFDDKSSCNAKSRC